jgi:repressor LexA
VVSSAELKALEVIIDSAGRGEPISSYAELASAAGLRGRSRVGAVIASLEAEGLIEVRRTAAGRVRTPSIRPTGMGRTRSVPVLGRISAGRPILAGGDDVLGFVSLPADRARGAEVYVLEVKGESMTGDGILDGDHVVVAADPRPAPGAIAVVLIGEEATVKHIYYEGASIRLTSSNPDFPDQVYGADDFPIIQGRVIGVLRWLAN